MSLNLPLKTNSRKVSLQEEAFCMVESGGPLCCSEFIQIWNVDLVPQQMHWTLWNIMDFIFSFSILLRRTCSSLYFILFRLSSWTLLTPSVEGYHKCSSNRLRRPWGLYMRKKWCAVSDCHMNNEPRLHFSIIRKNLCLFAWIRVIFFIADEQCRRQASFDPLGTVWASWARRVGDLSWTFHLSRGFGLLDEIHNAGWMER